MSRNTRALLLFIPEFLLLPLAAVSIEAGIQRGGWPLLLGLVPAVLAVALIS